MSNHSLEVLYARRPKLNYVSPAVCEAVFSSTSFGELVLEALPTKPAITGSIWGWTPEGGFELTWNNYPGALCYSVYRLNDANDPLGDYTLIAECISDPKYKPYEWEVLPYNGGCYLITAVTAEGETPIGEPICNGVIIAPGGPLNALVGEIYSQQLVLEGLPGEPFDVVWSIVDGALPANVELDPLTGLLSGVPIENGIFNFVVQAFGYLDDEGTPVPFVGIHVYEMQVTTTTPECGQFVDLVWGSPDIVESGAFITANNVSENHVQIAAEIAGTGTAQAQNVGTIGYTGPEFDCEVTVQVLSLTSSAPDTNTSIGVTIYTGAPGFEVYLLSETLLNAANTGPTPGTPATYTFPFTVPVSVAETITVVITGGVTNTMFGTGSLNAVVTIGVPVVVIPP